jgi:membrane fusion protein (multidrug efflux system)
MNPIVFLMRRRLIMMAVVGLGSGGVLGLAKLGVNLPPPLNSPKISAWMDSMGNRAKQTTRSIVGRLESYLHKGEEQAHEEPRKVVVTSPKAKDVVISTPYVCQIHSRQHIQV